MDIDSLVQRVLKKQPAHIFIGENHGDELIKTFTSALISELRPHYNSIGLFLDALLITANVQVGDYDDGTYHLRKHVYKPFVDREKVRVRIYGIDDPRHAAEAGDGRLPSNWITGDSVERIDTWERGISQGKEPVKIILCGSNHIDTRYAEADIVKRYNPSSRMILVNWSVRTGNPFIEPLDDHDELFELIIE